VIRIEIEGRADLVDALGEQTRERLAAWIGLSPSRIRTRKIYRLDLRHPSSVEAGRPLDDAEAQRICEALTDPVAERGAVGMLDDGPADAAGGRVALTVEFLPGVTDSVGRSVHVAASDCIGHGLVGDVYSSTLYLFDGLDEDEVRRAATQVLHNPLIERAKVERLPRSLDLDVPRAGSTESPRVAAVPLRAASDAELVELSARGMLALSLEEMKAIQTHFTERGRDPTDAELECLAQTWSEHCKHKIFASPIAYRDPEGNERTIERGLFRSLIRGATERVAEDRERGGVDPADAPFLVSVFHDNAGVVRFTEDDHLVYKVETHNSPSALDPFGGAMTGIVGVNRDSFGTGVGADLLTNVWGYCLGDPRHEGKLPRGLMHPRRIRDGVHHGVIDGGNHSGIPYSRGFELFDDRYAGKPLVYCGTVAVMPATSAGHATHEKRTAVGDKVVMIGGRIGKDGIHGATFSSVELDEDSPVQAVQIGDPIVQRMMFDMLTEARDLGLYRGLTDNGAGGLSSSVGEMAEATGGARIDLARAPLKYPGLSPWEILISEAQERMTVAVPPEHLEAFLNLAERREVEAAVLGEFTDSGRFEVLHGDELVADLPLLFMHEGVPLPTLQARWSPPEREDATPVDIAAAAGDEIDTLLAMLRRPSFASAESRARGYDHEVKGLSVVKPLVGVGRDVPATATVMRARHGRAEGVVLAEGIHPSLSDIDTHAMAHACVDEAVRRVLCAGARLDRLSALDNFCWPDPIVSTKTPDGEHKLAQLVRACEGLYEACVAHGVPLISGKDSMKNDANLDGVKISIPPTLLVSVMGQLPDVGKALTLEPRGDGERLYLLGSTRAELGGSELSRMTGTWSSSVPQTDPERNAASYRAFEALRDAGCVRSAHALGRGGLGMALAHVALSCELDVHVERLPRVRGLEGATAAISALVACFAESTGRIVFTVRPEDAGEVEAALAQHGLLELGRVANVADGRGPALWWPGPNGPRRVATADLRAAYRDEGGLR